MSGIQVLLHWLWEREDKWRCAALYFHVRILFFHLIGLSSHSMRCRQRGNRKWRWGMERRRSADIGWGEEWGPTADDLWWSIPARHNGGIQTKPLLHIRPHAPAYSENARHTRTSCSFMHNNMSLSKVQGANRLNVQQERREKRSSFLTACLSSVSLHLFPRISQIRKKTFMREDSLSLAVFCRLLSPHLFCLVTMLSLYKIRLSNSKSLRSGNLLWYTNTAGKWQCNKLCSSDEP